MIEPSYSRIKLSCALLVGGLLVLAPKSVMAQANPTASNPMTFNCALEVAEIKTVIANERFDDYTLKQVQALMQDVDKALAAKAESACAEDVAKLKHILHLDH